MLFQSDEGKEPLTVEIQTEVDIVEARQKGRMFSNCLGFSTLDQARIITTISELSRNIYKYATTGKIIMEIIEKQPEIGLKIIAIDKGPGIKHIQKSARKWLYNVRRVRRWFIRGEKINGRIHHINSRRPWR